MHSRRGALETALLPWICGALVVACGSDTRSGATAGAGGTDGGEGHVSGGASGRSGSSSNSGATGNGASAGAGATGDGATTGKGGSSGNAGNSGGAATSSGGEGPSTDGGPSLDGGRSTPGAPALSGTRLKAKYVNAADGARIYRRRILWDTKLATDCSFRSASDGVLRCLPVVPDLDALAGNWGQVFFTDAQCKNAFLWIVPAASGCTLSLPPYVYEYDAPPYCGLPSGTLPNARVYAVGAAMAKPAGTVYSYNGTDCGMEQGGLQGNRAAYSLGTEVDPGTFVAGTRKVAP